MRKIFPLGLFMLFAGLCHAQIKVIGRVKDPLGKAISGASVSIEEATTPQLSTKSDGEGIFYFSPLKSTYWGLF